MQGPGALRAVLFDMDGLLIDSERLWLEVEFEVVARLGGRWTEEHQHALVGGSLAGAVAYMLELTGADVPAATVGAWLLDGMAERLGAAVPLLPGAKELLAEVRAAGVPAALVSSSHRRLIEPVLDAIGREHFAVTVAGDEVARTKPDPEPYRTAAARLGADPRACVVLEDSPNGLAAAEAAGCATVAVPSLLPVAAAPGRTVVASLRDVDLAFLRSLVPSP
ncbi:2-deoxyglucose-6-phosphate phosphatase [Actinomadura rubteroloni]|uniref:2-deoxyglucose-6-phosphate phosphatase n=1 Tax=Actinomadura rubteroloni TaxID=1926885 RepID=A0A2P4UB20_9ACTN|nr:HAD family phosphatase [Actinomadura rubteroloni]POM22235.1 2-deoxyglucose-6-phosphate phosphatase [Actinomadura rubteroloni]